MIEYKKMTIKELDIFIDMRIKQLREEGAEETIDLKSYCYQVCLQKRVIGNKE